MKTLVTMHGGPFDGYDDKIEIDDRKEMMTPARHHAREAGYVGRIPVYLRLTGREFIFSHYRKDSYNPKSFKVG